MAVVEPELIGLCECEDWPSERLRVAVRSLGGVRLLRKKYVIHDDSFKSLGRLFRLGSAGDEEIVRLIDEGLVLPIGRWFVIHRQDVDQLRGLFGLASLAGKDLYEMVDHARAEVVEGGWVLENGWFLQSDYLIRRARDEQICYVRDLSHFYRIVNSFGPVFKPYKEHEDRFVYAFRGQTSEHLFDDDVRITWSRRYPSWFQFMKRTGRRVSLEPGIHRRELALSEGLSPLDAGTLGDLKEGSQQGLSYPEVAFRARLRRRLADETDLLGMTHRALDAYLGNTEPIARDWWILESLHQHYGPATNSLDLTVDPEVALYFAKHRFVTLPSGRATYVRSVSPGVVYVFALPREEQAVHSWHPAIPAWIDLRDELRRDPDLRPCRQSGLILKTATTNVLGGPFDSDSAGASVVCRMIIDPDVYSTAAPQAHKGLDGPHLFPGREVDRLYDELLRRSDKFATYEWDPNNGPF